MSDPTEQPQQVEHGDDGTLNELLTFFDTSSPSSNNIDAPRVLSVDTLLHNLTVSPPKVIFGFIVPHLFHKDPKHQDAAQTLFTSILSHKPFLLSDAAAALLSFVRSLSTTMSVEERLGSDSTSSTSSVSNVQGNTTSRDEYQMYSSTLKLMISQLSHASVSIADIFASVLEELSRLEVSVEGTTMDTKVHPTNTPYNAILDLLLPISSVEDATLMIRYYSLIFKIISYRSTDDLELFLSQSGNNLLHSFYMGLENDQDPLLQMGLLEILEQVTFKEKEQEGGRDERICDWVRNWREPVLDRALLKMVGILYEHESDMGAETGSVIGDNFCERHPFCSGAALRILSVRYMHLNGGQVDFVKILMHFGRNMKGEVEKIGFIDGITTFCCNDGGGGGDTDEMNVICKSPVDTEIESSSNLGLILHNQELLEEWLSFRVAQSKLKAVIMNSVARVLGEDQILQATRMELYDMIGRVNDVGGGEDTTQIIMQYVKGQVVELRLAAYEILTAVAKVHMGARTLMRFGGFFEFLCNRNLEVVREGKELKYGLVKAVLNSEVRGFLTDDVVKSLEQVVADGPYYVKKVRDVALE